MEDCLWKRASEMSSLPSWVGPGAPAQLAPAPSPYDLTVRLPSAPCHSLLIAHSPTCHLSPPPPSPHLPAFSQLPPPSVYVSDYSPQLVTCILLR